MYTSEKRKAILKYLANDELQMEESLSQLRDVALFLSKIGTMDQLPLKVGLDRTMSRARYRLSLIREFKKELMAHDEREKKQETIYVS